MKRCPECRRDYYDDSLLYCLDDGASLLEGPASGQASTHEPATVVMPGPGKAADTMPFAESETQVLSGSGDLALNSIAVLPFVNRSADAENEYFCDGLAEELINALAKIDRLKVAARSSAFSFKGKSKSAREVGKALNVKSILEGSVRKSDDELRITVQLIDANDGYHIWSERYDRETRDLFAVQDAITLAVTEALKVKLLGNETEALLSRQTDNTEAYELYLKGLYHYHKYTPQGWLAAIEFFEQVIAAEPEFAPAHAKLSAAIGYCWFFSVTSSEDAIERSRSAALRSLELDPRMDDAYEVLGRWHFYHDWNWLEAEQAFRKGIEINPNNAEIHAQYGLCLVAIGRYDEAVIQGKKALALDPLSVLVNLQVGWLYLFAGRLDDALSLATNVVDIEPNAYGAYCQIGVVLSAKRKLRMALDAFERSLSLGRFRTNESLVGSMYAIFGKREEAEEILHQLLETKQNDPVAAIDIARIYSAMGETDVAFDWLEKAVEERNGGLVFLRSRMSGFTRKTRRDARFAKILQQVGLPDVS